MSITLTVLLIPRVLHRQFCWYHEYYTDSSVDTMSITLTVLLIPWVLHWQFCWYHEYYTDSSVDTMSITLTDSQSIEVLRRVVRVRVSTRMQEAQAAVKSVRWLCWRSLGTKGDNGNLLEVTTNTGPNHSATHTLQRQFIGSTVTMYCWQVHIREDIYAHHGKYMRGYICTPRHVHDRIYMVTTVSTWEDIFAHRSRNICMRWYTYTLTRYTLTGKPLTRPSLSNKF